MSKRLFSVVISQTETGNASINNFKINMLLQIHQQAAVKDLGDRFIIDSDGLISYLSYKNDGITLDLYSAYVPESLRGNGYAASLILFALQYAVLNGLRVKPNCAAVKAYIKVYPEWRYIIDKASHLN